jgi:16S rRNA (guanine527-N7)-methyltransferase
MVPTDAAGVADAAREARRWFEHLLAQEPLVAELLPPEFADRSETYVALLLEANRRLNLTRITDPRDIAVFHLLDAVDHVTLLDTTGATSAVDLGSGGGLPGIPLAIARPELRWTLVDSVAKKADALRGFVDALGLTNVSVVTDRAETLGRSPQHRERHDFVAARACAPLPVLAELALPLLAVGGVLLAWKGPLTAADAEVRRGRAALATLGGRLVDIRPATASVLGGHTFVLIDKVVATPDSYPRRPGEPSRRPLG